VEVLSPEGEVVLSDTRVALCRCGASKNKPLCDNSHVEAKFQDPGGWDAGSLKRREADGPTLRVRCLPDGPLLLEGPFRLVGADGTAAEGSRAAACRCGASENKPFCDGTHSLIDFKSA
jgi:CDGSH-type Zn-finger protein